MQDPTPGMVRGGLHAFESLMNSMYGRQRLAAMIMEMGYLEPLGQLALIHMQLGATGEGVTFAEREYDQETGKGRVKKTSVTFEDLNSAYEVSISSRAKAAQTTELNERIAVYQATANNPFYDPYAREEFLVGTYPTLRSGLYSREKIRQIQEQQAQQQQQAAAQEAAGGANNVPGGTPQSVEAGAILGGAQ
jgi:hypothetical protein